MALAGVTDRIVYLEEGDIVDLQLGKYWIVRADAHGAFKPVERPVRTVVRAHRRGRARAVPALHAEGDLRAAEGDRRHARCRARTSPPTCSATAPTASSREIDQVLILACGTSYLQRPRSPRYWLESIARHPHRRRGGQRVPLPRDSVPEPAHARRHHLAERRDRRHARRACATARSLGMAHTLTVCNVASSAMVRECAMAYLTRAGIEIGVASTKAFTTQLVALFLLTLSHGAAARPS